MTSAMDASGRAPFSGKLAPSRQVPVSTLSQLFRKTTNSYKFVYFLALLNQLEEHIGEPCPILSFNSLMTEVLALAWYPHVFFKLSFGRQDKISIILDDITKVTGNALPSLSKQSHASLKKSIRTFLQTRDTSLLRYVPYRLLTPFFQAELRGLKDCRKNATIQELSHRKFSSTQPLYRIWEHSIELHPSWIAYLHENLTIVRAWASWKWFHYLQTRNPHVPAVGQKLFPITKRASLGSQQSYWNLVLEQTDIPCLYSGDLITHHHSLDHFLPWSFVLHDQIWNLFPVSPSANSSKSNHIPDMSYLPELARIQAKGLTVASKIYSQNKWNRLTEDFLTGLRIPSEALVRDEIASENHQVSRVLETSLLSGYQAVIPPLSMLAKNLGFPSRWTYPKRPGGLILT
jgi:hypothetical protein